ncbi:6-bladed beta-propeller [Candidatus Poribacteria bacterium]|nr:6-bladed beta-propeller [Candidatus Poribacteria bacterium]
MKFQMKKRPLLSNLKSRKVKETEFLGETRFLLYTETRFLRENGFLYLIFLPFCLLLGCAAQGPAQIVPPQIVTSTSQDVTKPRLLGVNYLYSISRQPQESGLLSQPMGLALDVNDNVYVADAGNHCIQVLNADGDIIMVLGRLGWRPGEFDNPVDVEVNFIRGEFLYVADAGNDRIQACSLINRIFGVVAGKKSGESIERNVQSEIQLDAPGGIATDGNSNIYIADTGNHRFLKLNPQGKLLLAKGTFGWTREQFSKPTDLVVDSNSNIYVVDTGNNRVQKFDFSGNLITIWGKKGDQPGQFNEPRYITVDRWDNIYVVDHGNCRIQVFDLNGEFLTQFSFPTLNSPMGIVIGRDDKIYVTDVSAGDVKVFQSVYR